MTDFSMFKKKEKKISLNRFYGETGKPKPEVQLTDKDYPRKEQYMTEITYVNPHTKYIRSWFIGYKMVGRKKKQMLKPTVEVKGVIKNDVVSLG